MQEDIVAQGLELMLYGMGTVVVFLAVLVVATTGMSRVVGRFFPEPVVVPAAPAQQTKPVQEDAELVAVISAALHQHRRKYSQRSK